MFNGSNNLGNDARGWNGNNMNASELQRRFSHNHNHNHVSTNNANSAFGNSASNNIYHSLPNASLFMRSSQAAQRQQLHQDSYPQTGQNQNQNYLGQTLSERQQRLLEMRKSEFEAQQIANNIKESFLIKQRLESIKTLQQQEANKLRTELQLKAAVQQATSPPMRSHNSIGNVITAKSIPSTSNSSVLPTKQRADEMTKPDLSTLAETAVAVASATAAANVRTRNRSNNNNNNNNNNSGIIGVGNMIERDGDNASESNRIARLLGSRASSSAPSTIGLRGAGSPPSRSMSHIGIPNSTTNDATMDAFRRENNSIIRKLHQKHGPKRSYDYIANIAKGNTSTNPIWMLNSSSVGSDLDSRSKISFEQLRNQQQQNLQFSRRNTLPVISSEFESAVSLKRQRLLEEKVTSFGRIGLSDAMEQMRQLDSNMKLNMHAKNQSAQLAQLAAKVENAKSKFAFSSSSSMSQERRPSFASSITSAPGNLLSVNSFNSPPTHSNHVMMDSAGSLEDRGLALNKLNKLSGGFPMPKFSKSNTLGAGQSVTSAHDRNMNGNVPAEITPDCDKDVVNVLGSKTLSVSLKERDQQPQRNNHQLRYLGNIGGFPMPPLYRQDLEKQNTNDNGNEVKAMNRDRYGNSIANPPSHGPNNAISNHIKKAINRGTTRAPRPPALNSYKRVWRDIRVVAGDDPEVDDRLRKEVFARKLHRGEIFARREGQGMTLNNNTNAQMGQQRLSDLSQNSNTSGMKNNDDEHTKTQKEFDESIVI